jgi:hypothetical protein
MTSTNRLFESALLSGSSLELRIGRARGDLCTALSEVREMGNQSRRRIVRLSDFVVIAEIAQRIAERLISTRSKRVKSLSACLSGFPS